MLRCNMKFRGATPGSTGGCHLHRAARHRVAGLAQQLLDDGLGDAVRALAEVVVADPALRVDEVA